MNIDNAQLSAFAAILATGTFELAARRLHVTPSAISQRIRLLEDRVGQILIQRSTPCQATAAGRLLLRHAQEVSLLEAEMFAALGLNGESAAAVRLPVVVNADSLDSWFGAVFAAVAADGALALDVRSEDQDHSLALMRDGTVMAAVSASASPIQGCRVEPLGVMRYLAVAAPAFQARHFPAGMDGASLNAAPMLIFNQKDGLQRQFVARVTGLAVAPPQHFIPSTRSFFEAARHGLGWGMMPEQLVGAALAAGQLHELAPDRWLDIPLFWHRWRIRSSALDALSAHVHDAARLSLRDWQPTVPAPAGR